MSHIFDALQRSEANRANSDALLSFAVTELLERAERAVTAASSGKKAEAESVQPAGSQLDPGKAIFSPDRLGREAADDQIADVTRALEAEKLREVFTQFQSLQPSIPENSRLVCLTEADGPGAEAFRLLAVRLRHIRANRELRSVLITSTVPGDGKTLVAANLACTLASRQRHKVLLVDGDVRRASLGQLFGLPGLPGLCNYLHGERNLIASIYRLEESGVWFLPAGDVHRGPLGLAQSPLLAGLIQKLNVWFDWIIIDSPPALPFADTSIWARVADAILFIARRGVTEKRKMQRALEALDPKKLVGAVMNSSNTPSGGDYYSYKSARRALTPS